MSKTEKALLGLIVEVVRDCRMVVVLWMVIESFWWQHWSFSTDKPEMVMEHANTQMQESLLAIWLVSLIFLLIAKRPFLNL